MIIDFNDFFRMRVDVLKINEDLFQLVIEKILLEEPKGFHSSKSESFLTTEQLRSFVNYINEVTRDHI
jgi:hypothetical protein